MKRALSRIPLLLLIAGTFCFGGLVFADTAVVTLAILDDYDMLKFTFCPEGELSHTISFLLQDEDLNPVYNATPRLYFYNIFDIPSVVFCDDPDGDRPINILTSSKSCLRPALI